MKTILRTLIALCTIAALPVVASAHGSLFTFKQIDGTNVIMVTHNVHDAHSGIPITYNLRFYNVDGQPMPFQTVETEVTQGDEQYAKQTIAASPNGDANFTYTFPHQGNYTLSVTFIENHKPAAHADFPLAVEKGVSTNFFADFFTMQSLVAFALGAMATALVWRRRQVVRTLRDISKKYISDNR
jgi:hypothetical protein